MTRTVQLTAIKPFHYYQIPFLMDPNILFDFFTPDTMEDDTFPLMLHSYGKLLI